MSSRMSWGKSAKSRSSDIPLAKYPNTSPTAMRVPRPQGFPKRTVGMSGSLRRSAVRPSTRRRHQQERRAGSRASHGTSRRDSTCAKCSAGQTMLESGLPSGISRGALELAAPPTACRVRHPALLNRARQTHSCCEVPFEHLATKTDRRQPSARAMLRDCRRLERTPDQK